MTDSPLLHLAIIPDGNRRWAKARALLPWNGHEKAVGNFRGLMDWCKASKKIGVMTIWCFSTENWKRSPEEVKHLMDVFEEYLKRERENFHKENVRFVHSGRRDRIPATLKTLIEEIERETAGNGPFTLHLAIDYGGRDAVVRAVKRLPAGSDISEEAIRNAVDHPELPDIDLIIRTSGEQRTSNFFFFEASYAEWFFLEKHFPDLTETDLADAVSSLAERKRRFGK